jgi:hypothetical protein
MTWRDGLVPIVLAAMFVFLAGLGCGLIVRYAAQFDAWDCWLATGLNADPS